MAPQPGETWLFDNGYIGLVHEGSRAVEICGLWFEFKDATVGDPMPVRKLS